MGVITLVDTEVIFTITPKKNKNTYFRFQKDGTISITKSRYQSKKEIIDYMKRNESHFLQKRNNAMASTIFKDGYYYLFGKEYKIEYINQLKMYVDEGNRIIYLPHISIDHEGKFVRKMEREMTISKTLEMAEKHKDNGHIDIMNITYKSRHTKTRFGSCNPSRRTINMNANLIHYNELYLEYVFLHEICHLVHKDHSKNFYNLLETICPNYRKLRQELRKIYR